MPAAMILGHPLKALAQLANSRTTRGPDLKEGSFAFLGSIVETRWPDPGDRIRIEIEALGALELEVSP